MKTPHCQHNLYAINDLLEVKEASQKRDHLGNFHIPCCVKNAVIKLPGVRTILK